jgi:hypothetical protein
LGAAVGALAIVSIAILLWLVLRRIGDVLLDLDPAPGGSCRHA